MRVVHREGQGKQGHEEMYLELLPGVETFLTQVTGKQFKQLISGFLVTQDGSGLLLNSCTTGSAICCRENKPCYSKTGLLILVIVISKEKAWLSHKQTNGRYQTHYLRFFAVDNKYQHSTL